MGNPRIDPPPGFVLEGEPPLSSLPDGFVLEESQSDNELPEGFVLEKPRKSVPSSTLPPGFVIENRKHTSTGLPEGFVLENTQPAFTDQSTGYWANVRSPIDLIKNESFVSNVFKIITGNTAAKKEDRKIGLDPILQNISTELGYMEQQGRAGRPEYEQLFQTFNETKQVIESEPEFNLDALIDAAKSDPGGTLAEFQNALLADPYLVFSPLGWEKAAAVTAAKLAKSGKTIQSIGSTSAGITGAAATGAAVVAPLSIASQLEETGEVDSRQLAIETAIAAIGSSAFGGLFEVAKVAIKDISATAKNISASRKYDRQLNEKIEAGKRAHDAEQAEIIKKASMPEENAVQLDMLNVAKTDKNKVLRIDSFIDDWEGELAVGARAVWQFENSIKALVPNKARREKLSHFIEGDDSINLSPDEVQAATSLREYFDRFHALAKSEGVLDAYVADYSPHLWKFGQVGEAEIAKELSGSAELALGRIKESKYQSISTLQAGIKKGLEPVTLDAGEIAKLYGNSINRAISNKKLVDLLHRATDEKGTQLIMAADKAPADYVLINHPSLGKKSTLKDGKETAVLVRVHPDIEQSLKFVFEANNPNIIMRSALALNFAMKRSLVSMSAFHANALLEKFHHGRTIACTDTQGLRDASEWKGGGYR